jgi:hypothetical protein
MEGATQKNETRKKKKKKKKWNTYHFESSHVRIGRVPSCQITNYEHLLERRVESEYGRRLRRCKTGGVDVLRCVRSLQYQLFQQKWGGKIELDL